VQRAVTHGLAPGDRWAPAAAEFLSRLRLASARGPAPLPSSAFANEAFSKRLGPGPLPRYLAEFPAVLALPVRIAHFQLSLGMQQQQAGQSGLADAFMQFLRAGRGRLDALLMAGFFVVEVRREQLLGDTMYAMERVDDSALLKQLMVVFHGEEGVDAGGVTREYFHLLTGRLFSPDFAMFRIVDSRFYWFLVGAPAALAQETLPYYAILGTMVALAIYNRVILPIRFPLLLYKKLLGMEIGLADIEELDAQVVSSLRAMLAMPANGEDAADLGLSWVATAAGFESPVEMPLCPDGDKIPVTNDNVDAYVAAYVDWVANESVLDPFRQFQRGFQRIFRGKIIETFAADELDILVSGEEVFDWDELERNAKYVDGYRPNSRAVRLFWEIFKEFSPAEKARFLCFTTGTDRVPLGGLSNVAITIQRLTDTSKLPISHTCFSVFGLPEYRSKEEMARKIRLAISETEGFGLQ
jgi:ubiquitin-protein ligase E3 A